MSRRHLINSSDVFVIKGFTVSFLVSLLEVLVSLPTLIWVYTKWIKPKTLTRCILSYFIPPPTRQAPVSNIGDAVCMNECIMTCITYCTQYVPCWYLEIFRRIAAIRVPVQFTPVCSQHTGNTDIDSSISGFWSKDLIPTI